MEKLLEHLGYATPFVYAAAAYGLFSWLDENASDEAKAALASLMRSKRYGRQQTSAAMIEIFDRLYSAPLLTWRAFARSVFFTGVVTVIFLFEAGFLNQNDTEFDYGLQACF